MKNGLASVSRVSDEFAPVGPISVVASLGGGVVLHARPATD